MTEFTEDQKALLNQPLHVEHVSERKAFGGSGTLSYIEQHANRIFGYDGWTRETVDLRLLGESKNKNDKDKVAYMATVRITVGDIIREGSGYGNGVGNDPLDVHELAIKEAESDAMKRALMTFGDQFGLALYDKTQKNVAGKVDPMTGKKIITLKEAGFETAKERTDLFNEIMNELLDAVTPEEATQLYQDRYDDITRIGKTDSQIGMELVGAFREQGAETKKKAA